MMKDYFMKNKHKMFPEIKNWKDPMNHHRFNNNVKDMSFYDWLWFHPSAYSLLHFGYPILAATLFGLVTILTIKIPILPMFAGLGCAYFIWDSSKKIKNRANVHLITMHDIYLRENEY